MILLTFTLATIPDHYGKDTCNCYISSGEPTHTDSPGDERRAQKEVESMLEGLVTKRNDEVIHTSPMPSNANPIFSFAFGIAYDRENKIARYKAIDHDVISKHNDEIVGHTLTIGMDLFNLVKGALNKAEIKRRKQANCGRYKFDQHTLGEIVAQYRKHIERLNRWVDCYEINRKRFDCPNLHNGCYCSPIKPDCPCFRNGGKCEEVVA